MRIKELIGHLLAVEHQRGNILVLMAHPERDGTAFELARADYKAIELDHEGHPKTTALVLVPRTAAHTQAPGIIIPATQKGNGNGKN